MHVSIGGSDYLRSESKGPNVGSSDDYFAGGAVQEGQEGVPAGASLMCVCVCDQNIGGDTEATPARAAMLCPVVEPLV